MVKVHEEIRYELRENTERWLELCAEAAIEQNPDRLMKLIAEIDELLRIKEQRLEHAEEPK